MRSRITINMAGEIFNGDPENDDQSSVANDDDGNALLRAEDKVEAEEKAGNVMLSFKFHVETIRLIAFSMFLILIITNMLITELYINKQPDMDPTKTVIYGIFGFNHPCNWFDHNPARLVAAIQIPFVIIPLVLYVGLFHLRLNQAYKNKKITRSLLLFSQIVSPFNAFAMSMIHIWFVNPPDGDYGFVGHYVPYAMFEYALALMAILQTCYLTQTSQRPCGLPHWSGIVYASTLIINTTVSFVCVVALLAGKPILDPVNNQVHNLIFRIISYVFLVQTFVVPTIFAAIERKNGDSNKISYMLSKER